MCYLIELFGRTEHVRQEEVQQRPELVQVVLFQRTHTKQASEKHSKAQQQAVVVVMREVVEAASKRNGGGGERNGGGGGVGGEEGGGGKCNGPKYEHDVLSIYKT